MPILEGEVGRTLRHNRPFSLAMLDIDYFKRFNDRYGHPAGDDCLCRVGRVIAQTVRRPADLAVRYGGEEFTILLPDLAVPQSAGEVAGRILREFAKPFARAGQADAPSEQRRYAA